MRMKAAQIALVVLAGSSLSSPALAAPLTDIVTQPLFIGFVSASLIAAYIGSLLSKAGKSRAPAAADAACS